MNRHIMTDPPIIMRCKISRISMIIKLIKTTRETENEVDQVGVNKSHNIV